MPKLSTKITFWYIFSTGIIIMIMAVSMYIIFDKLQRSSIDTEIADFSELLISGLDLESRDIEQVFRDMLKQKTNLRRHMSSHLFMLTSRDSILYESYAPAYLDSLSEILDSTTFDSANPTYSSLFYNNNEYRIYSEPIAIKTKPHSRKSELFTDLHLIIVNPMNKFNQSLRQLRYILFLICPVALLIAALTGYIFARRSLIPVHKIAKAAEEISSRNLEKRVPVGRSNDELAYLARTFNDMIQRLDDTFKSQQRFIADTSHDIKTPLTIIQLELELLKQLKSGDIETIDAINKSLKEIARLNYLTESLMFLARADASQLVINPTVFFLDELLMEVIEQFKNRVKAKELSISLELTQHIETKADRGLLQRALVNVIDNAVKFSPENGRIRINLDMHKDNVEIMINNGGKIIPDEMVSHVFERFKRADQSRTTEGFGLGLSIVKKIIELHNGDVSIQSIEDSGTTLKIFLPL